MANSLSVYQCHTCGKRSLIPQGYCFSCRSKESFRAVEADGKGTIFSYTRIHIAEERLQGEVPYTVAVIECEDGLRLLGRLAKGESDRVHIGAIVELLEWKEDVPIFKIL